MSSKTNTDSTIKYDSGSSNVYNQLQPQVNSNLTADMNLDPSKSPTYALMLAKTLGAANQISGRNQQNFLANQTASGINPSSGYVQSGLDRLGRNSGGLQANAFISNLLNYDQMRRQSVAQAQGYRPLQTGQSTTQTTSGLGTWLPQVASAGIGAAAGFFGGGGIPSAPSASALSSSNLTGALPMAGTSGNVFGNYFGAMGQSAAPANGMNWTATSPASGSGSWGPY